MMFHLLGGVKKILSGGGSVEGFCHPGLNLKLNFIFTIHKNFSTILNFFYIFLINIY